MRSLLLPWLGLACLAACASRGGAAADAEESALVGATAGAAPLQTADAVGAIFLKNGNFESVRCTGTLVAPRLVLTSKDCVSAWNVPSAADAGAEPKRRLWVDEYTLSFATGVDVSAPTHKVAIEGVEMCTTSDTGGVDGNGCNVALYRLAAPITDIAPLPWSRELFEPVVPEPAPRFGVVGYGTTTLERPIKSGKRHSGRLTLQSTFWKPFEHYDSANDLVAAWAAAAGVDAGAVDPDTRHELETLYDTPLLDGEALLGGASGDARICFGDEGSPLIATGPDGTLSVRGVAGHMLAAGASNCGTSLGSVFGTFGSDGYDFLEAHVASNPCGDENIAGRCDGSTAVRCTKTNEGLRRIIRVDCAAALQRCVAPASGTTQVACGD